MFLPRTYDALIEQYRGALPLALVKALMKGESDFDPNAKTGSYGGLLQVGKEVLDDYNAQHQTTYTAQDLFDPETNIKIACWLLNVIVTTWTHRYPYLSADWSRRYAALLIGGWNEGWSKFGMGKAIKWLHDNGKELTLDNVAAYKDQIGAARYVGNAAKVAWAKKVVDWYTAEQHDQVENPPTPGPDEPDGPDHGGGGGEAHGDGKTPWGWIAAGAAALIAVAVAAS